MKDVKTPSNRSLTTSQNEYTYADNTRRTKLNVYVFVLFSILAAILLVFGIYLLNRFNYPIQNAADSEIATFNYLLNIYDQLSALTAIVYLACVILFLPWMYRANNNTFALNKGARITFTPFWGVVSFFIPIVSFYFPYKTMKDIWRLSGEQYSYLILLIWWWAFLFMNFMGTASFKLSLKHPDDYQTYLSIDVASNFFGVVAAICLVRIMLDINKGQQLKYSKMQK